MSRMPAVPAIAITSNPLPGDDRIGAPFARWNSHDLAGHVGQQLCGRVQRNKTKTVMRCIADRIFPLASVSRASLEANGHSRDRFDRESTHTLRFEFPCFDRCRGCVQKQWVRLLFCDLNRRDGNNVASFVEVHIQHDETAQMRPGQSLGIPDRLNHSHTGARRGMFHAKRDLAFHYLPSERRSEPRVGRRWNSVQLP